MYGRKALAELLEIEPIVLVRFFERRFALHAGQGDRENGKPIGFQEQK